MWEVGRVDPELFHMTLNLTGVITGWSLDCKSEKGNVEGVEEGEGGSTFLNDTLTLGLTGVITGWSLD